ncbi:uncharacterized protein EV420DRAFT_1480058 [Desarmillaria tabescens]|uniref:Uncharacterized protein n=1 Tax=Armillaria tabescens TaxID=1929756 RepID=A0AA39N5N3_ARMTA|nr:uncharacterized protein EV420DRAFT_1480058 [Desarmillaria tabescens]KAK0458329.1 hypothetical protein EV420DRAFT_1480058 [Desarmillaria tabescens]
MEMLSNLLDSWGLNPPSRIRQFVFDVVAFRDELAKTHPKQWSFVMNANASILSTKQNMTFTYAISSSDPMRLVQVDISGDYWELDVHCDAPNRDPEADRKLLENEAWVDTKSIEPTHVRCKACKQRVNFFCHNFYFREWQDHRDYCPADFAIGKSPASISRDRLDWQRPSIQSSEVFFRNCDESTSGPVAD